MEHFDRKVFYSGGDKCWIAVAPELPGCSAFGDTPTKAVAELEAAMELWLAVAREDSRKVPEPLSDQDLQGRILLRLPKTLQKALKEDAAEEGVSVNQYALFLLSSARSQVRPARKYAAGQGAFLVKETVRRRRRRSATVRRK